MSGISVREDLLTLTGQAGYEWNIVTDRLDWSDGFAGLAGLRDPQAAGRGRSFETLIGGDTGQSRYGVVFAGALGERPAGPVHYQCVYAIGEAHLLSGTALWLEDTGVWFPDANGKPAMARGVVRVITERRKREDQLRRRSDHDDLTGLPNRRFLEARIAEAIEECRREGTRAALLLLCIERMDLINDFYGFRTGDEVLKLAGERIAGKLRSDDVIARFSGAKFAILLKNCKPSEVYTASRRFIDVLGRKVVKTSAGPVLLGATVGACELPLHARTAQEAVAACFSASRSARRDKKLRFSVHDSDPDRLNQIQGEAQLASEIMALIEAGRMRLAFQPVVEAVSGRVAFHEALMRLENDKGSIIRAAEVLPLAEKLGFMRVIDAHVLDLALDTLALFPQARLAINVSNASAEDPDWLAKLAVRFQSAPDIASRLIVEITESHAAADMAQFGTFASIVRSIGCKVAIDDFGAGYTSFASLKSVPVDIIKIDGSFASDLAGNRQNQAFMRCLIDLARAFDVKTVVEWVETAETAALLAEWGVDYLQGNCFGPALMATPWPQAQANLLSATA